MNAPERDFADTRRRAGCTVPSDPDAPTHPIRIEVAGRRALISRLISNLTERVFFFLFHPSLVPPFNRGIFYETHTYLMHRSPVYTASRVYYAYNL